MNLSDLGWGHFFQQQISEQESSLAPARVYRQDLNRYQLFSELGELTGTLPGRIRNETYSRADLPTVGDWVLVRTVHGGESTQVQIERLLERKSRFSRKQAGDTIDEQVIAANIDIAFIVSGLDEDFNPNRVERYLLLAWDSGALPVIILNKADLCPDLDAAMDSLRQLARGTPIHVTNARQGDGLQDIRAYLEPGSTCVLLGSSGVGKSTIINALLGFEKFATGEVRADDSKGRHTTTFREMAVAEGGGLIIDTPGMRELQIWADSAALSEHFDDIEELALQCKFSDCQHESEPGCAVKQALDDGLLTGDRLASYYKLRREVAHFQTRETAATRAQRKQALQRFSKLIRNRPDKRD